MGVKSSKSTPDIKKNIANARIELNEHLEYLNKIKNSGTIIFSTHWENDYYYVTSSQSSIDKVNTQYKILNKKLIYETCKPEPNMECSICLDPLDKNAVKLDNCNHMFHKKCIKKLISGNQYAKCPLCRGGNDSDAIDIINNNIRYREDSPYSMYSLDNE
tara:strand:+ start:1729 stop:2208 length:480 start_codon:yes stop_codon:yes gene_type:complete